MAIPEISYLALPVDARRSGKPSMIVCDDEQLIYTDRCFSPTAKAAILHGEFGRIEYFYRLRLTCRVLLPALSSQRKDRKTLAINVPSPKSPSLQVKTRLPVSSMAAMAKTTNASSVPSLATSLQLEIPRTLLSAIQ